MKNTTKQQLLAGTSALALVAAASLYSAPAYAVWGPAADGNTITHAFTATEVAGAAADSLTISNGGSVTKAGGIAVDTAGKTGVTITINNTTTDSTTPSLKSTGNFNTIDVTGATATLGAGGITVTAGTVTGNSTGTAGTIAIDGAAGTYNITNSTGGTISNTGTGGNVIVLGDTNSAALGDLVDVIKNSGAISATNNASSVGIDINDTNNGNTTTITNSGTINVGALGTAIKAETGSLGTISITNSGSGVITGGIDLSGNATGTNSLTVSGGSINGNVKMGVTGDTLALSGGQINGKIDGQTAITLSAGNTGTGNNTYITNGDIGSTTATTSVTINAGKTLDVATNNNILKTGAITLGASSTLNVGTGAIAGTINGAAAGNGSVNFKGQGTTANTSILGGGNKLAAINIYDGDTLSTTKSISATNINIGTGSTGVLTTNGALTLTGLINGGSAGTGTLNIGGAATTTLGAASTIGATNGLATINIATGSTLDASTNNDSIKATNIALTGTGALTLGTGAVTGAIDGVAGANGSVTFNGNNTTNGNIGATKSLATVTVAGGSVVNLATNNNSIAATTVALTGSSTLTVGTGNITGNVTLAGATTGSVLNLNSTGKVSGTIDGTADGTGSLNIAGTQTSAAAIGGTHALDVINVNNGGTLTLGAVAGDTLNAITTTVNTGGTLNFGNTLHTNTGNIVGAGTGTINLGTQTQILNAGQGAGNFTTAAGGQTIDIGIRSATTNENGTIVAAGAATVNAATKLFVDTSATTGFIKSGTTYQWLGSASDASAALANGNVTTNSVLLTFAETANATARTLTATRIAGGYAGVSGLSTSSVAAGAQLNAMGVAGGQDAGTNAFFGVADSSTSAAALNNAIKTATPQVNQGGMEAVATTAQSMDVVGTRLDQLRAGIDSSSSGMAAGGAVKDKGVWIQGFGTIATQDQRDGVDGFNATSGGVAIGADTAINDTSRLGLSVSYAKSSVDGNGTTISNTDIDSYQLNLYGSHNIGQWYTDGLLGAAYHNYDGSRNIAGGAIASTGDYNGETYSARVGGGYRYTASNGMDLTPNASLTYDYNHVEGYTETGAGGLDNTVGSDNTQALIARIGADLGYNYNYNSMLIRPVIRAAYMYDFIGDQDDTTAQFAGGGAVYRVRDASPARSSFDLGASLNVARTDNISFSADYDFVAKQDYTSHTGILRARYSF